MPKYLSPFTVKEHEYEPITACQRWTKVTSLAGETVRQLRCTKFVHGPARRSALK